MAQQSRQVVAKTRLDLPIGLKRTLRRPFTKDEGLGTGFLYVTSVETRHVRRRADRLGVEVSVTAMLRLCSLFS